MNYISLPTNLTGFLIGNDGRPVNGFLYIGKPYQDPRTAPAAIYDNQKASTDNPIIIENGTYPPVLTDENRVSLLLLDSRNRQVWYLPARITANHLAIDDSSPSLSVCEYYADFISLQVGYEQALTINGVVYSGINANDPTTYQHINTQGVKIVEDPVSGAMIVGDDIVSRPVNLSCSQPMIGEIFDVYHNRLSISNDGFYQINNICLSNYTPPPVEINDNQVDVGIVLVTDMQYTNNNGETVIKQFTSTTLKKLIEMKLNYIINNQDQRELQMPFDETYYQFLGYHIYADSQHGTELCAYKDTRTYITSPTGKQVARIKVDETVIEIPDNFAVRVAQNFGRDDLPGFNYNYGDIPVRMDAKNAPPYIYPPKDYDGGKIGIGGSYRSLREEHDDMQSITNLSSYFGIIPVVAPVLKDSPTDSLENIHEYIGRTKYY